MCVCVWGYVNGEQSWKSLSVEMMISRNNGRALYLCVGTATSVMSVMCNSGSFRATHQVLRLDEGKEYERPSGGVSSARSGDGSLAGPKVLDRVISVFGDHSI